MENSEVVTEAELIALETGALDPAAFPHREHVRFAHGMLRRYSFGDAVSRFSKGLRLLAAKAGKPEIYHETITVAFLAAIAERQARDGGEDWWTFAERNSDLLDKRCLERWYPPAQLSSDLARKTFCLPEPWGCEPGRLNDARAVRWLTAIFSGYIVWSSAMTLMAHARQHSIILLAGVEIAAAVLFLFSRTRLIGLGALLAVFAIATFADLAHGGMPMRFLYYGASAILITRLCRSRMSRMAER